MNTIEYLRSLAKTLVRGSAHVTPQGVTLFTPDGVQSYDALWLRDFSYMAEYAPDSLTSEEIKACLEFALRGARRDGWLPDRRYADGLSVYAAGMLASPVGLANLDTAPFAVFIAREYVNRTGDLSAFRAWYPALMKAMRAVPLAESGLVYSDPRAPHSPYGFTDTVRKTGELLTESVLYHRACGFLSDMCRRAGIDAHEWDAAARRIEENVQRLYDPGDGAYFAATGDCRQKDVWGNALMCAYGFPCSRSVYTWLDKSSDSFLYKGQVRHLPRGEYWQSLLIDVPRETYQNGAYWATASGWIALAVFRENREKGLDIIADAVCFLMNEGAYECVNEDYRKLPSFVVSAANVLGGLEAIIKEDSAALSDTDERIRRRQNEQHTDR